MGDAVQVVTPKKLGRASMFASGDAAVKVPRKKAGAGPVPLSAADAVSMPRKKAALRKEGQDAEALLPADVDVKARGTIVSARLLTTIMQLLILGLSGFVASQQFQGADQSKLVLIAFAAWLPVAVRGVLLAGVAVLAHCFALHRQDLWEAWARGPSARVIAAHFALAVVNFVAVAAAPQLVVVAARGPDAWLLYYAAAPLLWAGYLATGFALLLPGWNALARPVRRRTGALGALVLLCYVGWRVFEHSDYPSSSVFTQATMALTSLISAGLGHPIHFVKIAGDGIPVYRAGTFNAFIFPGCSGLEGMMLTAGLLLAAVAMERQRLRIGLALLLVGLAVCCAFLANAVRLAVLFYIGDFWSPEVAENGFHANFGVVSFVCISSVFFLAMRRYGARADGTAMAAISPRIDLPVVPPMRLAYPLSAMVAATLLCGLFSGSFNWLYPVPALIGAVLLIRLRLPDSEPDWAISLIPIGAGVLVYWLWIMLVPANVDASDQFAETLFGAPPLVATIWLLARFAGSILVVPIAEELTFRALLVPLTMRALDKHVARGLLAPMALLLGAIAFGALHSGVLAGMVAGMIFGLVFWRRRSCRDAVLAHACSNLLLCLHALSLSQWSYL